MTQEDTITSKPIQTLSWADKIKNNKRWFRNNADYAISQANFDRTGEGGRKDYDTLYQVYNNQFPMKWFEHVTDPLSAKVAAHKAFPAKVRPVTIIRTNIDLLMAEYPRRPFIYTVNNLGEGGYNAYTTALNDKMHASIEAYFTEQMLAQMSPEQVQENQGKPAPVPEEIQKQFHATYKDAIAIKAQKWVRRALREYNVRTKFLKMFKDWLIVGEAYSYKGMEYGSFCYEHISPKSIFFIKSDETDYIEDADTVVVRRSMTVSDVVDRFYEELSKEDILNMEQNASSKSPESFYNTLKSASVNGLVDVYHITWKARKKLVILHRVDQETGEEEEIEVDESYPVERELGEWVEVLWPNEIYETWRIGPDKYVRMQAIEVQRNEMNNFSACKQPYNGRNFSSTHATNISVMEIGIPFQIMYIIVTRTLELTIAKSKGKIMLIDHAAIPNEGDWDEEKFFYYAEALGYGLLNRNQIGVDKSWNQYQVMDMSLFENIKQLIDLQNYFKQQWDDVIGINRQRKGQTYASDLVGVNERATFQSTIITDMIFNLFEEFTEKELQGIIDFSKFVNVDGVKSMWNDDVHGNMLLEIDPNTYCNAELGILIESSSEAIALKNKMEATVTAMLQNQVKPSTIATILKEQSISELETKLKEIEAIQASVDESTAKGQQEAEAAADARKEKFEKLAAMLKTDFMNEEYDRKEDIEMLRGEFNTLTFKDGDSNANGIPDVMEVQKHQLDRERLESDNNNKSADRAAAAQVDSNKTALKNKELDLKEVQSQRDGVIKRQQAKKAKTTK
jgi:hypothetical protein